MSSERRDKKSSFRDLNTYIASAETGRRGEEKTLFTGTRNIGSAELREISLEMAAVAAQNIRVNNPISHAVMSWRQGEVPTKDQVEECVDLYLQEMGLESCQVFYGLHKNTENIHLHLSINRVDPDSYYAIQPAGGWWKKAGERVARQIEIRHGWETEQSGRYEVLAGGQITEKRERESDRIKTLPPKAKDFENFHAEKSALRIAQEQGAEIIKKARPGGKYRQR